MLSIGTAVGTPVGCWRFVRCRSRHKRREGMGWRLEEVVQAGRAGGRRPPFTTWRWGWDWFDHEKTRVRSVGHCKNGGCDEASGIWRRVVKCCRIVWNCCLHLLGVYSTTKTEAATSSVMSQITLPVYSVSVKNWSVQAVWIYTRVFSLLYAQKTWDYIIIVYTCVCVLCVP